MQERYPGQLRSVDFVRIRFQLEFQEPYNLTVESALRLRRNLRQALHPVQHPFGPEHLQRLFDPPLSSDPVAVRRFQRPSPLFVIFPPIELPRNLAEGDLLDLEVIFWGTGAHLLGDFILVLQALGRAGWHRGEGRFELAKIDGIHISGDQEEIWSAGQSPFNLTPPVFSAAWWLDEAGIWEAPLELSFHTPARIVTGGRPLFQPSLIRLFPFLLRRVTSMVYACCGLELMEDPERILKATAEVREEENTLRWSDWRSLERGSSQQEIGGITGSVLLQGDALAEILWVLNLASLMNLGKGASYGAGRFLLSRR